MFFMCYFSFSIYLNVAMMNFFHEIVEKLQNLLGQYEQFTRRYTDVVQDLQEQERTTDSAAKPNRLMVK